MKPVMASLALLLLSLPLEAEDPAVPKLDVHGDPIPAGGDICLGTTRFRHGGGGLLVAFTPDGETLVTANIEHAGNAGDRVSFCDVRTGKLLRELKTGEEGIEAFAVSANRKTAAVLTVYGKKRKVFMVIRLVDLVKREWISRTEWQPPKQQAYADWGMTFTPDDLTLILTARGGEVLVWDVASRQTILDYKMSLPEKTSIDKQPVISPDGQTLINTSWKAGIVTWNWLAGKEPVITPVGEHQLIEVAASPEGHLIAYGITDYDGVDDGPDVGLWNIESKQLIRGFRFPGKEGSAGQIEFSPDGRLLAAADSRSRTISLWKTETGERLHLFDAISDRTDSLAFSPDGNLLASAGGSGGAIRVWDIRTGERIAAELEGHELWALQVAFPAEATGKVFSASDDGAVFHWNLATGRAAQSMRHSDSIRGLAVSADGRLIASSGLSDDNTVRLWDAETGQERFHFPGHGRSGGHRPVTFLDHGQTLASFGEDMNLRLWDTETGNKVAEHALRPSGIDFSKYRPRRGSNGEVIKSLGGGSHAADAGTVEGTGEIYISAHGSVFSPDGSLLIFPFGKTLYVFETATGKESRKLENPFSSYHRAVSPDNRRLAATGPRFSSPDDRNLLLLSDLETGEEIWRYEFPGEFSGRNGPGAVTFSPDGNLLAVSVRYGWGRNGVQGEDRIEVWNAKTHEHLLTIDQIPDNCGRQSLSISADNRYIAGGQMNSTILVWDLLDEGLPESLIGTPAKQDDEEGNSR